MKNPQWKRAAFLWDVKRQKMKKNKNRGGNTATAARPHCDTNQFHVFVCLYRIPQRTFTLTTTPPPHSTPAASSPHKIHYKGLEWYWEDLDKVQELQATVHGSAALWLL